MRYAGIRGWETCVAYTRAPGSAADGRAGVVA